MQMNVSHDGLYDIVILIFAALTHLPAQPGKNCCSGQADADGVISRVGQSECEMTLTS